MEPTVEAASRLRTESDVLSPTDTAAAPATPVRNETRLILITLDGVRWQDVVSGTVTPRTPAAMPHLHRFIDNGGIALGGPGCPYDVRASGPSFVSLPGYFELFSGAPAANCLDNACDRIRVDTVLDAARAVASSSSDVAVFASWAPYARAVARDPSGLTISAGRIRWQPSRMPDPRVDTLIKAAASGAPYPGWGDYRPDAHTARVALRYLEAIRPHVLVLGLGDADEFAHRGDRSAYVSALREADDIIHELADVLDRLEPHTPTAIVVTTDHGRASSFRDHGSRHSESARVFVAAFGDGVVGRGFACASRPLRLADLAPVIRLLGGYPQPGDSDQALAREMLDSRAARRDRQH